MLLYLSNNTYVTWEFNIFNHLLKTRNYNKHGYTATSVNNTNKATLHGLTCSILFNHTKIQQITYESSFNHILIIFMTQHLILV